jgi:multidrug efflux pump subunit AcrA (membrane-fusion protein)
MKLDKFYHLSIAAFRTACRSASLRVKATVVSCIVCLALFGALTIGCTKSSPAATESARVEAKSAQLSDIANAETLSTSFKSGKGLWVPEVTRKSLGMRLVEITERSVTKELTFNVQVYRGANELVPVSSGPSVRRAAASGMVSIEEAKQLKVGQTVVVRSGDRTMEMKGRLMRLDAQMAKVSGFVEALVEFDDAENLFRIGTFLETMITFDAGEKVIAVPRSALLRTTEGDFVYAVSEKYLFRTPVKVGADDAEFVEIKDGLFSGDEVALEPVMLLWLAELAALKGGQACCLSKPTK